MAPIRLINLDAWPPVGGTVWEGLGGSVVTGGKLGCFKSLEYFQYLPICQGLPHPSTTLPLLTYT